MLFDKSAFTYYFDVIRDAGGYESSVKQILASMDKHSNKQFILEDNRLDPKMVLPEFIPTELYKYKTEMQAIYAGSVIERLVKSAPALLEPAIVVGKYVGIQVEGSFLVNTAHGFGHAATFSKHNPANEGLVYFIAEPTLYGMQSWEVGVRDSFLRYDVPSYLMTHGNPFKKAYDSGKIDISRKSFEYDELTALMTMYTTSYSNFENKKVSDVLAKDPYPNPIVEKDPNIYQVTEQNVISTYTTAAVVRAKFENHADNHGHILLSNLRMLDLQQVKGRSILLQEEKGEIELAHAIAKPQDFSDESRRLIISHYPQAKIIQKKVDAMRNSIEQKSEIIF